MTNNLRDSVNGTFVALDDFSPLTKTGLQNGGGGRGSLSAAQRVDADRLERSLPGGSIREGLHASHAYEQSQRLQMRGTSVPHRVCDPIASHRALTILWTEAFHHGDAALFSLPTAGVSTFPVRRQFSTSPNPREMYWEGGRPKGARGMHGWQSIVSRQCKGPLRRHYTTWTNRIHWRKQVPLKGSTASCYHKACQQPKERKR